MWKLFLISFFRDSPFSQIKKPGFEYGVVYLAFRFCKKYESPLKFITAGHTYEILFFSSSCKKELRTKIKVHKNALWI